MAAAGNRRIDGQEAVMAAVWADRHCGRASEGEMRGGAGMAWRRREQACVLAAGGLLAS